MYKRASFGTRKPPESPLAPRNLFGLAAKIVFLLGLLAVPCGYFAHGMGLTFVHHGEAYVAPVFPPGTAVLHVYFIGDSYTYVNDLPHMVAAVAASDNVNPVDIETGMVGVGNSTLDQLWNIQEAHDTLHSRDWDYVVLQEHSMQTLHPEWVHVMYTAMTHWNAEIRTAGAKPIIYETWARKPGSDWYDTAKYPGAGFGDPVYMQDRIDKVTNNFAAMIDASVVPVGDYWAACGDQTGMPDLYNPDGTHASLAGDYLISLLFYRALTGHAIANVAYTPSGMSPDQTQLLRKCAAQDLRPGKTTPR